MFFFFLNYFSSTSLFLSLCLYFPIHLDFAKKTWILLSSPSLLNMGTLPFMIENLGKSSFSSFRLHVQSPTCSSRSSNTNVSCTRRCWWSSSNFPLIPHPLPPLLVCTPLVAHLEALAPANQPWTPSQAHTSLRASPTHCTPKSRHLRPTPTAPTLSVSLGQGHHKVEKNVSVWSDNLTKCSLLVRKHFCSAALKVAALTYNLITHNSHNQCAQTQPFSLKNLCKFIHRVFHLLAIYKYLHQPLNEDQWTKCVFLVFNLFY